MSQARGGARRQTQQQFYNLGEAGRKTGVVLHDDGQRDENGFQPLDGIFSSPTKPDGSTPKPADRTMGEEDMEIDHASSPGPSTVMRNRRSGASILPISRSPARTSLGSPAIKNPRLSARMSPVRSRFGYLDSPVANVPPRAANGKPRTVSRNLFTDSGSALSLPKPRAGARPPPPPRMAVVESSDVEEDDDDILKPAAEADIFDESMQMIQEFIPPSDAPMGIQEAEEEEEEREPTPPPPAKKSGRPKKQQLAPTCAPAPAPAGTPKVSKARGGPGNKRPRVSEPASEPWPPRSPTPISADESSAEEEPVRLPSPKRPRTQPPPPPPPPKPTQRVKQQAASRPSPSQALTRKARAPGRPKKAAAAWTEESDGTVENALLAVPRGPPLPAKRGLMAMRADRNTITQTRSGRASYRPLQFWRGEHVEIEEEAVRDVSGKGAFVVSSFKDIVRIQDDEEPMRRKRRAATTSRKTASGTKRKASGPPVREEPLEEWEQSGGIVEGDVVLWTYEHDKNPPGPDEEVGIITEQLALAADAVETREIKDATFRYAKTMSLGFMGSGIVDLPPGAEKKPKNSRRMQLVFFVAYGKVKVTIHDNEFRIGAGGQFFVPRGNYYSIANDYDAPARIFFAQACEVEMQEEEGEEEGSGSGSGR